MTLRLLVLSVKKRWWREEYVLLVRRYQSGHSSQMLHYHCRKLANHYKHFLAIIELLIIATVGPHDVSGTNFGALHRLHFSFISYKLLCTRRGRQGPGTCGESWAGAGCPPRPARHPAPGPRTALGHLPPTHPTACGNGTFALLIYIFLH